MRCVLLVDFVEVACFVVNGFAVLRTGCFFWFVIVVFRFVVLIWCLAMFLSVDVYFL